MISSEPQKLLDASSKAGFDSPWGRHLSESAGRSKIVAAARPRWRALRDFAGFIALAIYILGAGTVCSAADAIEVRRRKRVAVEDVDAFLWAIRQVESRDSWEFVGGAYQFIPSTWASLSAWPYSAARFNRSEAERCAREFFWRSSAEVRRAGFVPNAYRVALRWGGWRPGEETPKGRDYAERVVNLYVERSLP